MAKIKLSKSSYTPIPEGVQVFKITGASYDEDFGKMEIEMLTADGRKHTERFNLIRNDGEVNEGALNAFSYFAKTVMNDFELEELSHEDLVGHFIEADVKHEEVPHRDDPAKTIIFIKLNKLASSEGFDVPVKKKKEVNLDELLK